jgi:hypothetical protein
MIKKLALLLGTLALTVSVSPAIASIERGDAVITGVGSEGLDLIASPYTPDRYNATDLPNGTPVFVQNCGANEGGYRWCRVKLKANENIFGYIKDIYLSQGGGNGASQGETVSRTETFQSVCGVETSPNNYFKERCEVINNYNGPTLARTILRTESTQTILVWYPNNIVEIQFEGSTELVRESYTIGEGMTSFRTSDQAYFYYSDRGAAEFELRAL